ncbi:secreted RxLR effector protein 161-like [Coffea arabica]|uniref:Secreted RxLR effector protein 161-like n=1 Tax=Coffea arabica TaxID=13443 RepID=A0ABM4VQL8_COFAR
MKSPTELHLLAAKRILRYLQGTRNLGIYYKKGEKSNLVGYTDSDYAGDQDDGRSTSGYVFMLGTGAICWSSKKQPIVTLSSTEAEFVAATACACQAIWLRRILEELQFKQYGATIILYGTVDLMHCKSDDQVADIFTKVLKRESFVKLRGLLGLCNLGSVMVVN